MIPINELRIGNYVKCVVSNDAGIYKVIHLDAWTMRIGLDGARQGELHPERKIKPIPLTPEILQKSGFLPVKDREGIYRTIDEQYQISFFDGRNAVFYIKYDEFKGYCYLNGLLFDLHQLQNFFFCLTGEELTL